MSPTRRRRGWIGRLVVLVLLVLLAWLVWEVITWPDVRALATKPPASTTFMERHKDSERSAGRSPRAEWRWVPSSAISIHLKRAAVVAEDGGFFRHHGFNLEAVRGAISENLRAGAYRRGAGTITMQLARNLYLGHERTLSRKAQEVVLAWVLEHLTGVSKERLLEIYLNIVEWGPGVHGAAEATHYYFGRDPARLTPAQALFLTTLLPAPNRWRSRFDKDGQLRAATRAQMRFIGRAMAGKGWLDPASLPAAESLQVEIEGPARAVLFPEGAAQVVRSAAAGEAGRDSSVRLRDPRDSH